MSEQEEPVFSGLMRALRADPYVGPKLKLMDEIEAEVAGCSECVMLDVAFSPVCLNATTDIEDAVEVAYKGADGRYVIKKPDGGFLALSEEKMKVARARYIVLNGRRNQPFIDHILRNRHESA